ncbi:MAG TPA: POTRA domain-containing protein [Chitinophagaceae bacterium]|nr:POTRA domain-containing protein [Chitinophagaceae bacterium]
MAWWKLLILVILCELTSTATTFAQFHADTTGGIQGPATTVPPKHPSANNFVIIRHIIISGNRRTKDAIILHSFDLKPGDTLQYSNAMQILEDNRQELINTSLFLTVSVYFKSWSGKYTDVEVDVLERWYTFGFPIFSLADRNFNVWWVQEKHSLGRVNYGFNFFENNLTGKNDQVELTLQGGYTEHFALAYSLPYFNKSLRSGLGFSIGYNTAREIGYATDQNKLQFFSGNSVINRQFKAGITYTYVKAIRFKHQVSLNYNYNHVADTLLMANPDFFPNSNPTLRYFELDYQFSYTGTDNWAYPLKGFNIYGLFSRKGLGIFKGINQTEIYIQAAKYWRLFHATYFAAGIRGRVQVPQKEPYFLMTGMGYQEDYLQGLEYYVVDGSDFGILKASLKRKIIDLNMHFPFLPIQFESIPVRVFLKVFGDAGYVANNMPGNNTLDNRFLYSGGFGLDIVTYYDVRLRLEYSFNQLGQKGLFLHSKSEF